MMEPKSVKIRGVSAASARRAGLRGAAPLAAACPGLLAVALLLGPCLAGGCGGEVDSREPASDTSAPTFRGEPPIRAVTTTGMVADLLENVGGELVRVEALMGEGTDPHFYRASPTDVKKLASPETDLVLYSGLDLEGKMAELLDKLARRKPVYAVTADLPESLLRAPPEFRGQFDPHVWFDVALWSRCAEAVRDVLVRFDAARAGTYRSRAAAYLERLAALDGQVREEIARIPPEGRILITAHDAFGYFGRAYGMRVEGIQGISTDSEAGVRRIRDLVELIVQNGVKAVFFESSVSDRNVRALVDGCRARGHDVVIGGQLYSDAMGKRGTPEGTYEGMVRHNVRTIVEALR